MKAEEIKYLIGIDEAGRGPLAGPVSVGAVLIPADFNWEILTGARDSKKMTAKAREDFYTRMLGLRDENKLQFAVVFSAPERIDAQGIVPAIRSALSRAIAKLNANPSECKVLLDGGLKAPKEYPTQETIIRGDSKEFVISAASIAAKVLRDRYMVELSKKFPEYGFDVHKGYGTAAHRDNIKRHGLSEVHRKSFCRSFDI